MKKLLLISSLIMTISCILFCSCKKESVTNRAPIANAGPDQVIYLPKDSLLLDGTLSTDRDGKLISYQWSPISHPSACAIRTPHAVQTMVYGLGEGTYEFELVVTDNGGLTAKDIVQIVIYPPTNECGGNLEEINGTLTEIGSLSIPQTPYVAAAGNKIVFAGGNPGSAAVDIYDIASHSWERAQLSQARTNMAIVSCGNKIFFAGGNDFDSWYDIVDIYDVWDGSWTVAHLSQPKIDLAATAMGDKVFFAGGITEEGWNQTNGVDIYDISEESWDIATLSEAKIGLTAVTAGNKIYFAGGWNYLSGSRLPIPLNSVDIFDGSTNTWSRASFNVISGGVSGVVSGDNIYWGGIAWSTGEGKEEIWNTANGRVTKVCLSYARSYPNAVARNDEVIFFTPGSHLNFIDPTTGPQYRFDIYNAATGQRMIGLLDEAIAGAGIIAVNNTIYVGGGKTDDGYTDKVYTLSW